MRKLHPEKFFTAEEKNRIVQAIRAAESETSAEIRVYWERKAKGEIMGHARKVFEKLGMTQTRHRNGVLIYFSLAGRAFAILGDQGIHNKVGGRFWQDIVATMEKHFSQGDFAGGLERGIREMGETLKRYFPRRAGDVNELPDAMAG